MIDQSVSRAVFESISLEEEIVFYLLAALSILIFVTGMGLRMRKYLRGRREDRVGPLGDLLPRALLGVRTVATNETVRRRDLYAGVFHAAIMWGFIALFIGTVILTIDTDIVGALAPGLRFFWGHFYIAYSFVLDVMGAALLVGVAAMAWRRARFRKPELAYTRVDLGDAKSDRRGFVAGDWMFLGWLAMLGLGGFLVEAVRIVAHGFPWFEVSSPVGYSLGATLSAAGLTAEGAAVMHPAVWWFHAIGALAFISYIPFSKAVHMFTDGANLVLRSRLAGRQLPILSAAPRSAWNSHSARVADDDHVGLRNLADFTWKQLLDFDACTKCGRCHIACPAVAAGAPLSPRDLILDLRQESDAVWSFLAPLSERRSDRPYGEARQDHSAMGPGGLVADGLIRAETLWACTTCLACVDACPVGIEHVPAIVGMRRSLIDEGIVESGLQAALTSVAKHGNSFGQSARSRGGWADRLPTPIRDVRREAVDWLWFVGDFASFDLRVQEATRLVARVFQEAGLDFGILFEAEHNSGNDIRRVGEEGLFEMLAQHNVGALEKAHFRRILTTDPHTLNTLRFEYPQFGAAHEVWHYSEVLAMLFRDGALVAKHPIDRRVTYHDPCYLARYAEVTLAPREVLAAIGAELVEMPRNQSNTFCCGAGGGRIWMDDSGLRERPSEQRMHEAASLARVTDFVTACPKDLTMYTAAAQATGLDGRLAVRDLIELVAESVHGGAVAPS
jgi:Fe-S oxidoreductase